MFVLLEYNSKLSGGAAVEGPLVVSGSAVPQSCCGTKLSQLGSLEPDALVPRISVLPSVPLTPHLNLSAHHCREFPSSSWTSHSPPCLSEPGEGRAREREREGTDESSPRAEVHLSGNPIKSQGEMLLCFQLIIGSLPCTEPAL